MPRLGRKHHSAKLTPRRVSIIRGHAKAGTLVIGELARAYRVDRRTIKDARDYVTWRDVPVGRRCPSCRRVEGVRPDGSFYKHGCEEG